MKLRNYLKINYPSNPLNSPSPSNPLNPLSPSNPLNPSNQPNPPSPPGPSHPPNPCPHPPNLRFKDSRVWIDFSKNNVVPVITWNKKYLSEVII